MFLSGVGEPGWAGELGWGVGWVGEGINRLSVARSRSAFCQCEKKREGGIEAKGRPESWKGAALDGG